MSFMRVMLAVACLSVSGCDLLGSGDGSKGSTRPLEGPVVFTVYEDYPDISAVSDPVITLYMETEKAYPCCNYSIVADVHISSSAVEVDLRHVFIPEICLTAFGPAVCRTMLDVSSGQYEMRFTDDSGMDSYTLGVTDTSLHVIGPPGDLTIPRRPFIWRYPPRSFAYVCGTTEETAWIYSDFRDSLLALENISSFTFPPLGDIPYPDSSGGHQNDPPALYFTYEAEEDFEVAGGLLAEYSQTIISQHEGVGIYLVNWRNMFYRSWLLENRDGSPTRP